jgi:hypothetical protein
MNMLLVDQFDIALDDVDPATAEAVRRELPAALQRRLASAGGLRQATATVDLGTMTLSRGLPPRALAEAIAARLGNWLQADPAPGH